ncbi:MAG: hypothetical protein SGILL_008961 [Bacillariaceae sp.]
MDDRDLLSESAESIDELLHATLNQQQGQDTASDAKTKSYGNLVDFVTTGIYAWGRLARLDSTAPEKAEALVGKLQETVSSKDTNMARAFAAMVYCWSQVDRNHPKGLERTSHWFSKIESIKGAVVKPETFHAYLRTIVRYGKIHAQQTQELLERYSFLKNGYTYSIIVRRLMDSEGVQEAYQALQNGIKHCLDRPDEMEALHQLLFDYFSQNAKSNGKDATSNENVLLQMISLQQSNPDKPFLQRKHFVVVMSALASKRQREAVYRLFEAMQELQRQGNHTLKPDYQILVIVLSALAKSGNRRYIDSIDGLLDTLEKEILSSGSAGIPFTNHAFNIALDFYAKVPGIVDKRYRIEKLMHRMEELSKQYNSAALAPDRISYASLIRVITDKKKDGFHLEIDEILTKIESSDQPSLHPDANIYSMVLDGYYQSGDPRAIEWAEKLKTRVLKHSDAHLDEIFYTLFMKICSLSGDGRSSDRALSEMIEAFEAGRDNCRPTEVSFVTAIFTWKRSGRRDAVDAALRLFNQMLTMYERGNELCKPGPETFGQLMVILAKSNNMKKHSIARRLLSRMKALDVAPDLMVLNWYIRVCGSGGMQQKQDRHECWQDALATLETIRKSQRGPNSHTYNSMLYACHFLMGDDNDAFLSEMKTIVEQCKEDGLVDDNRIMGTLKRLVPLQCYKEWTSA